MPPAEIEAEPDEASRALDPSLLERFRDRDHTRGNLYKSLLVLALPMVVTSLFGGVLYQIGDLKLISGLGGAAMTAVIVANQSLRQVFIMMVMGASFGTQGLIARAVGTGDAESADRTAGQILLMGGILSASTALIGILFAEELLAGMNVSEAVLEMGVPYVRFVFIFNFGFVFVQVSNALLGGAGDTTTPMLVSIIQSLTALLAEWCLIYGHFGFPALGIRGVAIGMFCGQIVGGLLIARVLFGGSSRIHIRLRHLRPDWRAMSSILGLSWPPAIQMLGSFLVTVIFIRLMGDFGQSAQSAYSIGLRLSMIGPMIAFPLAGATATLVGQNLGAGNVRRAWTSLWVGLSVHASLLLSLAAGLFFFRTPLLALFTDDPEVIEIGSEMLAYQSASFVMFAFNFVFFRALQGAGDVLVPMLLSLVNAIGVSLPIGYFLAVHQGYGPRGVFIAGFIGAVTSTATTGGWLATGRWTRRAVR